MFATTAISHHACAGRPCVALSRVAVLAFVPGRAGRRSTASFTVSPAAPRIGQAVTFTATATAGRRAGRHGLRVDRRRRRGTSGAGHDDHATFARRGRTRSRSRSREHRERRPTVDTTSAAVASGSREHPACGEVHVGRLRIPIPGAGVTFTSQSSTPAARSSATRGTSTATGSSATSAAPTGPRPRRRSCGTQRRPPGDRRPRGGRPRRQNVIVNSRRSRRSPSPGEPARRADGHVHVDLDGPAMRSSGPTSRGT